MSIRQRSSIWCVALCFAAFPYLFCGAYAGDGGARELETFRSAMSGLKSNDIQTIGTHNSYKSTIPAVEMAEIRKLSPEWADALEYSHLPLTKQLDIGMRAIELDVVYDPQGGRYAHPLLPAKTAGMPGAVSYDASEMQAPGFKVLHIPDADVRSSCALFTACLRQLKAWSDAHPNHVPILITINAKDDDSDIPGGVMLLRFDAQAFDSLDAEILSVFGRYDLITPDLVRGHAKTLRDAVRHGGWPSLADARGKFLFALDEGPEKVRLYMRGHQSLEGLPMFVNSIDEGQPHAAYFTLNDPKGGLARIRAAVKAGYLVRTRADEDTKEARRNDVSRREAAFSSGAQYISTDYPLPRQEFSDYVVKLPEGVVARINPVRISTRDKSGNRVRRREHETAK